VRLGVISFTAAAGARAPLNHESRETERGGDAMSFIGPQGKQIPFKMGSGPIPSAAL